MPSEVEYKDLPEWLQFLWEEDRGMGRRAEKEYLAMKSERDKYKAIVEADTIDFGKMLAMDSSKGGIMQSIAKNALALRGKDN